MKNKKGLLGIISLGIILILTFIFIAFFIFSTTFKFTIIGVALGILSFVVLLGVKTKNEITKIIIFIILLGVGMFFIFGSGMLQSFVMDRYVEIPFFATIECQRGVTCSFQYNLPSDGEWFYKGRNLPENADSYSIQVKTPDYGIISVGKRNFSVLMIFLRELNKFPTTPYSWTKHVVFIQYLTIYLVFFITINIS